MFNFSESDKNRIETAVKDLEKESSVELVPFFVEKSDEYDEVAFKIPSAVFLILSLVFMLLHLNWMLPKAFTVSIVLALIICVSMFSFLILMFFPKTRFFFVSKDKIKENCIKRAKIAFLEEELFKTKSRVGVLIFVSYLEKEVVVLGDNGINEKFEPSDWQKMVDDLILGIKKGDVVGGIVNAIEDCKVLVLSKKFIIEKDDKNELKDGLRIGE